MNANQIKMLRSIIKQEIEAAGLDGMEHGARGWAERQLDKDWEEFQESFKRIYFTTINEVREDALQAQLDEKHAPTKAAGVPWTN